MRQPLNLSYMQRDQRLLPVKWVCKLHGLCLQKARGSCAGYLQQQAPPHLSMPLLN